VEHAKVWALIAALWPHAKPTTETIIAAEPLLLDLDYQLTVACVQMLNIAEDAWPPSPGRLRKAVVEAADGAVPADVALAEVQRTVRAVGRYRVPEWSSPGIAACVEAMGGWEACCNSDNPEAFRAHFLRLYEPMAKREAVRAALPASVRAIVLAAGVKRLELEAGGVVDALGVGGV
jgi:hypothetical protein